MNETELRNKIDEMRRAFSIFGKIERGAHRTTNLTSMKYGNFSLKYAFEFWHSSLERHFQRNNENGASGLRADVRVTFNECPIPEVSASIASYIETYVACNISSSEDNKQLDAAISTIRSAAGYGLSNFWTQRLDVMAYAGALAFGMPGYALPTKPSWSQWLISAIPGGELFKDTIDDKN